MKSLSIFTLSFVFYSVIAQTSAENIMLLKQGALFVRLKTSELQIKALTNKGMTKEAEEIRKNQENKNQTIADAFKKYYTFSKVYFFYSNHSAEVKNGNYSKYLMNSDLQIDSSYTGNFLMGEFDQSETNNLPAFYIKNKNFDILKRPFPYLIKCNKMLVTTKSEEQIAKELNSKLFKFWEKRSK